MVAEVDCGQPVDHPHAVTEVTSTTYLSHVTYNCEEGYERERETVTSTCREDGQWTNVDASCTSKTGISEHIDACRGSKFYSPFHVLDLHFRICHEIIHCIFICV